MDHSNEKNGSIDDSIINGINNKNSRSSEKDTAKSKQTKAKFVKRIVLLGIIFTIAFGTIQYFLKPI
ncbi:MAG TPA: hypothetical protein VHJ38_14480, partial [Nitrososphaeraceae archaeon]|nr:hypothetical protein [Nitrososphaeraceae archaeon]